MVDDEEKVRERDEVEIPKSQPCTSAARRRSDILVPDWLARLLATIMFVDFAPCE